MDTPGIGGSGIPKLNATPAGLATVVPSTNAEINIIFFIYRFDGLWSGRIEFQGLIF
jgi:hypothetical protein